MIDSQHPDNKAGTSGKARPEDRRVAAVAIRDPTGTGDAKTARIEASGRGFVAEEILALAFASGVKVREDAGLAEILAALDVDTPIPPEAVLAVADILARVYEADRLLAADGKAKSP